MPASPPQSPLLAILREGTRAAHLRIESLPNMACLMSPDLTAGAYIAALRAMASFHLDMQRRLAPLARQAGLRGPDPAILPALAADLAWFGIAVPPPSRAACRPATVPAMLGGLYVVEGSALGGRVIGRAVAASLSVSPGRGGTFYGGTSADGARDRWRAFCGDLERVGASLDEAGFERVVAGANAAFGALERRLRGRAARPALHQASAPMPDRARAAARIMI